MTEPTAGPQTRPSGPGGLGQMGEEEFSIAQAVGGPLGLVESVLPYAVFSIVFGVSRELAPSLYAAAVPVVVLALWRIVRRESLVSALSGVVGVAIGAFAAAKTGDASNFFLPTILKNVGFALAYAVSNLVRWPLLGIVVGSLTGSARLASAKPAEGEPEPTGKEILQDLKGHLADWRRDPAQLAAYRRATWIWAGMFAVRAAVQTPLYLADAVTLLGLLNGLVLGVPLFVLTLWLSWLVLGDILRTSLGGPAKDQQDDVSSPPAPGSADAGARPRSRER